MSAADFFLFGPAHNLTCHYAYRADDIDLVTGELKDLSIERVSYARAQKMRAAVSHKFGRGFKIGAQMWCESQLLPGIFLGNPSLSVVVSEYMISLRRRKVRISERLLYPWLTRKTYLF